MLSKEQGSRTEYPDKTQGHDETDGRPSTRIGNSCSSDGSACDLVALRVVPRRFTSVAIDAIDVGPTGIHSPGRLRTEIHRALYGTVVTTRGHLCGNTCDRWACTRNAGGRPATAVAPRPHSRRRG